MNKYELMKKNCVLVNDGSGVLVNVLSSEYSYVFTAKHVLKDENTILDFEGNSINVIDVLKHDKADCAIVKIEYVPNVHQLIWKNDFNHNAPLMLVGAPGLRRSSNDKIKLQDGKLTSKEDNLIIFTAEGIPGKELINGMSGGGIYYIDQEIPYLIGIEYGMDGVNEVEQYGRLCCLPLNLFEEIIEANGSDPILPYFFQCFSRLREDIFKFNVISPENIRKLQEKLGEYAEFLISNGLPKPYQLMIKYKENLLLDNDPKVINDKELWIAYMEFMVLCAVIDGKNIIEEEYINKLDSKRRMIYSRSREHWVRSLSNILKVAKEMLEREGTLIIHSMHENPPISPPSNILEDIIDDISSVPSNGIDFEIDNASENIYKTFTIAHLKGLSNSYVVDKEDEYGSAKASQQLLIFKRYYSEIIKKID